MKRKEVLLEIRLKSCPKTYIKETHRSKTPDETRRFVETMTSVLGMRDFRDITDLDRLGIPVFTCHRIRPDGSRTDHTGKGASPVQARVSLTMESVERFSSEFRPSCEPRLIRGRFDDLSRRHEVVDPAEMILPRGSGYTHSREISWTRGFDLLSGKEVLVPAAAVYHPFHVDEPPLFATHTNGIASGNTLEEAVFHALTEVIERDAWSIAKYNEDPGEALYLTDSEETRFLAGIVERFIDADLEVVAKDITSDLGVPVIAAFSRDLLHRHLEPVDGFGSHLDPKVALARAVLEIATTRGLYFQKFGFTGSNPIEANYLSDAVIEGDWRFFCDEAKSLDDIESRYSSDILADIETILGKLRESGFARAVVADLTAEETGIPTVRVIVPGAEVYCFDPSRLGKRLARV
jgi:ribosomal protein S12 methylthiotransferase accessory factor